MSELFESSLMIGLGLGTGFAFVIAVSQFLIAALEVLDDWFTKYDE